MDRATGKKPKEFKHYKGQTFEESIFDDSVMMELMEANVADIYTTDIVAAVLMCSTKSNYSWDIEIKKFDGNIFMDKRQDDPENYILNHTTCNETSLEHQPYDDGNMNGIKSLWKEAQQINDTWLNLAQDPDVTKQEAFDGENPFIEEENQVATRMGYVYKVWKLQEEDKEKGLKEKKICIRCSIHTHNGTINGER